MQLSGLLYITPKTTFIYIFIICDKDDLSLYGFSGIRHARIQIYHISFRFNVRPGNDMEVVNMTYICGKTTCELASLVLIF